MCRWEMIYLSYRVQSAQGVPDYRVGRWKALRIGHCGEGDGYDRVGSVKEIAGGEDYGPGRLVDIG